MLHVKVITPHPRGPEISEDISKEESSLIKSSPLSSLPKRSLTSKEPSSLDEGQQHSLKSKFVPNLVWLLIPPPARKLLLKLSFLYLAPNSASLPDSGASVAMMSFSLETSAKQSSSVVQQSCNL